VALLLVVPAVVAFFASADRAYAVGGTDLLTNGDFETNGGSLTGWSAVLAKLSVASDGVGGGHAALASVHGKANASAYGLTSSSPPVTRAPAGDALSDRILGVRVSAGGVIPLSTRTRVAVQGFAGIQKFGTYTGLSNHFIGTQRSAEALEAQQAFGGDRVEARLGARWH